MEELLTGRARLAGYCGKWDAAQLEDIATFYKGRGLPKSAIDPFGANSCVHYGELFTQYREVIEDTISRTNNFKGCVYSLANDVLMPTSDVTPNGLAKASCVVNDGIILGGDILIIRPVQKELFGPFLSYVIRFHQKQILQLVTGSTVFHLYANDMKRFAFLLPSVAEQRDIVAILSDMDVEIDALEQKLAKAREVKQGMMQQLLTGQVRLI